MQSLFSMIWDGQQNKAVDEFLGLSQTDVRSMQHGNDQVCWNSNIPAQRRLTRAIDQYIDTLDSIDSMVHTVDLLRITKRRLEDTISRELKNSTCWCYQDAPANRKRCRQTIEPPSCCAFENNDIISGSDADSWHSLASDSEVALLRNSHGEVVDKDYAARLRARLARQAVMAPSSVIAAQSYSHPAGTFEAILDS